MTATWNKPLMAGGLWFPELEVWSRFGTRIGNLSMVTEAKPRAFTTFTVSIAPLAGVVTINEQIGADLQPLARVYKEEGEWTAGYFHEEIFNETDLIRFSNVFKAAIA